MAYRGAGRWDVGQVRLRDGNSEARRDVAVHQMAALQDELDIFGLEKEDRQPDAAHLNCFLMLKPEIPLELPRQVAATQERPADRAAPEV